MLRCRSTAPLTPWLLHESERVVYITRILVARTAEVFMADGCGPWILRRVQQESPVREKENEEDRRWLTDVQRPRPTVNEINLLNMLRSTLCETVATAATTAATATSVIPNDDQGDVLRNAIAENVAAPVFVQAGPLGDA